jgi:hypothetical protein
MPRKSAVPAARRVSRSIAAKPDLSTVPDFSTVPEFYGMQAVGDCLVPLVEDGAQLVFSQTARPEPGDLVAVYLRPELARPGGVAAVVKRLAFSLPGFCTFPYTPNPGDNVVPVVICESLNPPCRHTISADKLQTVHKCVGIQKNGKIEPIAKPAAKPASQAAGGLAHAL